MDLLRLRYRPDDEWLGELVVSVSAGGFCGTAKAWFSIDSLRDFAKAITVFPLSAETPPSTSGGFGAKGDKPAQDHVLMTFEQHNARGEVRATIRLATEIWKSPEQDLAKEITARFLITYGDLARFGPALLEVIEGRADEDVLSSSI